MATIEIKKEHYIYVFRDPRKDGNPVFYVGKGKDNRLNINYSRNPHTINKMKKIGFKNVIREIAYYFENAKDAYKCEKEYIDFYGLENLTNMMEGGIGADSSGNSPFRGKKHTKESKDKISKSHRGSKSFWYGRKHTDETKRKMSEAHIGEKNPMYGRRGELSPNFGKKISKQQIEKRRETIGFCFGKDAFRFRHDLPRDEIRKLYSTGNYSWSQLSKMYGCCKRTIGNIIHKKGEQVK